MSRAVMQQALEALVVAEAGLADIGDADRDPTDDLAWCEERAAQALAIPRQAITALREALAQPEEEPAALDRRYTERLIEALEDNGDPVSCDAAEEFRRLLTAPPHPIPQDIPQIPQEHSSKRKWNRLTPADYDAMRPRVPYIVNDFSFCDVAAIVEARLKEKNT